MVFKPRRIGLKPYINKDGLDSNVDKSISLHAGINSKTEQAMGRLMSSIKNNACFNSCYDPDIPTTVALSLVDLLKHFQLDCIKQCPVCHKYFSSTERKKSELCTLCLKKASTYKWREQNREVYNEYQRNIARGIKKESPTEIRKRLADEEKERGDNYNEE